MRKNNFASSINHLYELKNKEEVSRYIIDKRLIKEDSFSVEEIGYGNMNYVYRIKGSDSGKSFILKYAAKHTRISEDIMVSTDRIRIEAKALTHLSGYISGYVPHIYEYDEINNCILMEDYENFSIVRDMLVNFEQIPDFAEHISTYLVKSILPTSELVLDCYSKSELENRFSNPLCDITKTFVFTEPFDRNSSTNAIYEPNINYMDHEIFNDKVLLTEIEGVGNLFSVKKQALLHGDLHTGSIFSDKKNMIVFDYEFAFVGPIGFDIGNLIANLIFAWLHAKAFDQGKGFLCWIEETIVKTVNLFLEKFIHDWEGYKVDKTIENAVDIHGYLNEIIHDTAAFAGVELIRRVVGIAHVADITSITSQEIRIKAERIAIQVAKEYIINKDKLENGSDFVKVLLEIAK